MSDCVGYPSCAEKTFGTNKLVELEVSYEKKRVHLGG